MIPDPGSVKVEIRQSDGRFSRPRAVRGVRTPRGGPYALVRHPAYLGELAMIAACCLACPAPAVTDFWPVAAAVAAVALRISAEERVLATPSDYQAYARRVRWRLLPGLW